MQESISLALSLSFSFALSSSLALARLLVFNSNGSSRIALQTIYICDLVNVSDFGVPMSIISTCKLEFSMYRLVLVVLFSPLAEFSFALIFRHIFGWFFNILLCAVICPKNLRFHQINTMNLSTAYLDVDFSSMRISPFGFVCALFLLLST